MDQLIRKYYHSFEGQWQIVRRLLPERHTGLFLNMGCGAKPLYSFLLKGEETYGVNLDINKQKIAKAKASKNGKKGLQDFVVADASNMPFKDKSFDKIFMINLVEHLNSPTTCFHESFRTLKTNGKMLIITPNSLSLPVVLDRLFPFLSKCLKIGYPDRYYKCNTPFILVRSLNRIGFQVESIIMLGSFVSYLHIFPQDFKRLLFLIWSKVDKILSLSILQNLKTTMIFLCTR